MKRLISLLLILAMTFSFVMVVSAVANIGIEIKWYEASYDEDEETWSRGSEITEANPGDSVMARITVPKGGYIGALDYLVTYDPDVLTYETEDGTSGMVSITETTVGTQVSAYITDKGTDNKLKTVAGLIFTIKDEPVLNLDKLLDFSVRGDKSEYYAGGTTKTTFTNDDIALSISDLSINGLVIGGNDPEPVFEISAAVDGTAVDVAVANSNLVAAGTVYVATFADGALVDCKTAALADGTTVFDGLEGDLSTAKVFVWDANMIPIVAAPIAVQ